MFGIFYWPVPNRYTNTVTVKDIVMADFIKKFENEDFRQKLAGWAIVAIIVYLVIAQ